MHGRDNTMAPGFPPEPGQVTAKFMMVTNKPVPPVMEDVPMFIYSPVLRCGVFYLARVCARLMSVGGVSGPDMRSAPPGELKYLYTFEATCTGPMPDAANFNYDGFARRFYVYYDADRGIGGPGGRLL